MTKITVEIKWIWFPPQSNGKPYDVYAATICDMVTNGLVRTGKTKTGAYAIGEYGQRAREYKTMKAAQNWVEKQIKKEWEVK